MNQNPRAWLLKDSAGNTFAVSEAEMVAYEQAPRVWRVPVAPEYCCELIGWQQRLIPLFHTALLLSPHTQRSHAHLGILAYQTRSGAPLDYLALSLGSAPHKIEVKENTLAPLPAHYDTLLLRPLAISCINYEGVSVPILDVAFLASETLREPRNMAPHAQ